jgi:hypothetical protein
MARYTLKNSTVHIHTTIARHKRCTHNPSTVYVEHRESFGVKEGEYKSSGCGEQGERGEEFRSQGKVQPATPRATLAPTKGTTVAAAHHLHLLGACGHLMAAHTYHIGHHIHQGASRNLPNASSVCEGNNLQQCSCPPPTLCSSSSRQSQARAAPPVLLTAVEKSTVCSSGHS